MRYYITKECGPWWSDSLNSPAIAWGVSEAQSTLAKRIVAGDKFLHYIDSVRAWAGYSTVTDVRQENHRDSHADWRAALPFVIPIKSDVSLNEGQCECTVAIPGLPDKHYHRQRAFTEVSATEAKLIIQAIDAAYSVQSMAKLEFHKRWMADAESYYWAIARELAGGKCQLCGENVVSWNDRTSKKLSQDELESVSNGFLDVAHIDARSDDGKMTPENLRALCPTCHRIVDRLSKERCKELLRGISINRPKVSLSSESQPADAQK